MKAKHPNWRSSEPPLRAELFSCEQLRRHAVALAGRHQLDLGTGPNRLLPRLTDNERQLVNAYNLVAKAEAAGSRIAPAGEWLLDNFYLITEQIHLTRLHLPRTYSRELPRLSGGAAAGFPRIYDIALELIAHVDGRVDAENIGHFVAAYQSVVSLTLGELWAVPIMLRLGMIENLRRVSAHIALRRGDINLASIWINRLLAAVEREPSAVLHVLAAMAESEPPFSNSFVEEFCGRLQGHGTTLATVESWIQHRLAEQGLTRDQLQRADNQEQAADQVSIGNSIGSLRFLNAMDWRTFVETMSIVEQILRADPAKIYADMDFVTRDQYRHCVEKLARQAGVAEEAVANATVQLATEAAQRDGDGTRQAHVGFHLIDKGRPQLERTIRVHPSLRRFLTRTARHFPLCFYGGAILTSTAAALLLTLKIAGWSAWQDWSTWLLMAPGIIIVSQAAVAIINLLTNMIIGPRLLPRLNFSKGIPAASRTMVVIPTLLTSQRAIADLLEGLEIRYLGNRDPNLFFALLTDFRDAAEPTSPDDAKLLDMAREGILALNARYNSNGEAAFHLFHRARVWNPHERLWMGYERKRGKLEQFNALLRGGAAGAFAEIIGNPELFPTIRYVITLDTDTSLPRDAARKLIGTIAHPLNQPKFDQSLGRVVEGYTILQPRTPISLLAANQSRFSQLTAGEAGIDPYTREVSDVYQDMFAEGTYVGKGIYDVDAFRQATDGQFPENLILSHDLIESGYARSALVGDVELHEGQPASFAAEMSRRHRWMRGDWQIAGWLLARMLGLPGPRKPNTLSALAWWKIFDNLRRSLTPPALLLLLLGGWMTQKAIFWTLFALTMLFLPGLLISLAELIRKPRERLLIIHWRCVLVSLGRHLAEAGLELCALPYRAFIHLDAIAASAGRMAFTRRGLLIWHSAAYAKRNRRASPGDFLREMWIAPLFGTIGIAWLAITRPELLPFAGPILLSWLASPLVGWWISRPITASAAKLSESQSAFLRGLARRTWRYFEELVNAEENWLPPDNIQEGTPPLTASRTSPTNIGMALLANLAAGDFGHITAEQVISRTSKTLATMEKLERFHGHLYNWYDTRTLKTLQPHYISSVDSGNLAGALATLSAGLLELKSQPIVSPNWLAGLRDTLDMLPPSPADEQLRQLLGSPTPTSPMATLNLMQKIGQAAYALPADGDEEQQWWKNAFIRQCRATEEDLRNILPVPQLFPHIPTLREVAMATSGNGLAAKRVRQIDELAECCAEQLAMDFSFLYDSERDLLAIGYNVDNRLRDPAYYDLLASEARLASFILIARNCLPQQHWFALGRQLTTHDGAMALLSWSGSMFEYLMPLLIMPNYQHTLLDQTYQAVVSRQIEYGRQRGVPWGISESCHNTTDVHGVYQYAPFGVPGLGFKRGLADDLVVAPYASALALMVMPREACRNLESLANSGYRGAYGLYEAIDFTPARVPGGKGGVPIRGYMAHHQGMILLALDYLAFNQPMQRRFLADPNFKAANLLLQERVPKVASPLQPHAAEVGAARRPPTIDTASLRVFNSPHTHTPQVHLLSNSRYHVMTTNAGGGYSRWKNLAITRWREDATCDGWGTFCYLRDTDSGALWSTAYQPTRSDPGQYEAIFVQGCSEYRRRDGDIGTHTEIAVSPEDDVEVRRVTTTNFADTPRTIELTSYAEIILAPLEADLAHPAFSGMFVHTEILHDSHAILCTRRPRAPDEESPWMFHLMITQGTPAGEASYETDRAQFIGRGRSVAKPAAFDNITPLTNTDGAVLDPIVAIRRGVVIQADTTANWYIISGMAETRSAALALIDKYRDSSFAARAFEMAWSHSRLILHQLQTNERDAQVFAQLASSIIHVNPTHRVNPSMLKRNRLGQSGLWSFGISGDLPIILMRIADIHRIELVAQILKAHAYWREKGLQVDMVILNDDFSGYRQILQDRIIALVAAGTEADRMDKPAGIFLRRGDQLSEEERVLLQTVARVVVTDSAETLAEQVGRQTAPTRKYPRLIPTRSLTPVEPTSTPSRELLFFNGIGGFTPDGREYVITLEPGKNTPAPWSNVIANPQIGTVISESGGAYTWVDNAHEFRLTPWHNDPVSDTSGEAFYLRDEETGQFWSPTPLPSRGDGTYVCRHGFGYSVFEHTQSGIKSELWTYVALDAPVKFVVIKISNNSGRPRRLSATGYWEWVLGQWRHTNLPHVVTSIDPNTGAILASNVYSREFSNKIAFVNVNTPERTISGNRGEFLGRNGTMANPAAMRHIGLSGQTGAGFDPCAAINASFELPDGQERELVFTMGAANNSEEAQQLLLRLGGGAGARLALESVWEFWHRTLGVIYVETPDQALNLLVNGWLEYQTLSCRYWGKSGYYQSGGAYGFRDQLQDTMALLHAAPWTAREHLLRCAGRQFLEGDVQHWWHPPGGRGIRTHCSDDFLWLPYATCRYVKMTGDTGVLNEQERFLEGRPVNADEESYYDLPQRSGESGSLYEHCVRAIKHGLRLGEQGLPLIGGGDWNDGMNLVGKNGKGESVWLAFFLFRVLRDFAELARRQGDSEFADECARNAVTLQVNIEMHGWDGEWYRRATFDDGTLLGSASKLECQIDSTAQSWAVISGAASPERARMAMNQVDRHLVSRQDGLIRLFSPPFVNSDIEPGYIKGYPAGVRENGGQYTHGAVWAVIAFAEIGDIERAWELFSLINPIRHAENMTQVNRYRIEPYVLAADLYAVAPHTGRGGWSWYTGSAGWMYQLIVETLLGIRVEADQLRVETKLPRAWQSLKIHYRYRETFYHISVERNISENQPNRVSIDGQEQANAIIQLVDDHQDHIVLAYRQ